MQGVGFEPTTLRLSVNRLRAGGGRFRKMPLPDLTKDAVTTAYLRFSLPTVDEELKPGVPVFDEVRFVWDEEEEARR